MKIAILFRGPVRPDHQTAIGNIALLKDCFIDHDIDIYFCSWDSPEARKLIASTNYIKHYKLFSEPSQTHIINQLTKVGVTNQRWINSYKQYWLMKTAIPFVGNHDFIVQSRFDAKIKISKQELPNWLDHEHYSTIHIKGLQPFTNDQFGVANPHVMLQTWDYHDLNTLGQFMNNTGLAPTEQVLDQIIDMNGVKLKQVPIEIWELDKRRHHAETRIIGRHHTN